MTDRSGIPVVLCRLATRLVGLPIEHVIETMRPQPIRRLSGAPEFVMGIAVIRGSPIPVLDAGSLLGESASPPGRFVTLMAGGRTIALSVEAVVGIRSIPSGSLDALPPLLREAGAETITALGTLDAELLLVLRSVRLLPEELPGLTAHGLLHDNDAGS
jgi:purine-binding chemotaxis protein CheW